MIIEAEDWPLWLGDVEGDARALLRPTGDRAARLTREPPREQPGQQ